MIAKENQIVVYQPNGTVRLDVHLENETVWLMEKCCQCENVASIQFQFQFPMEAAA